MSMPHWIDQLADEIAASWLQWESEAGERAQAEQNTGAGEDLLHEKIAKAIEFYVQNVFDVPKMEKAALASEIDRLQEIVDSVAHRVAAQSELLGERAERKPDAK